MRTTSLGCCMGILICVISILSLGLVAASSGDQHATFGTVTIGQLGGVGVDVADPSSGFSLPSRGLFLGLGMDFGLLGGNVNISRFPTSVVSNLRVTTSELPHGNGLPSGHEYAYIVTAFVGANEYLQASGSQTLGGQVQSWAVDFQWQVDARLRSVLPFEDHVGYRVYRGLSSSSTSSAGVQMIAEVLLDSGTTNIRVVDENTAAMGGGPSYAASGNLHVDNDADISGNLAVSNLATAGAFRVGSTTTPGSGSAYIQVDLNVGSNATIAGNLGVTGVSTLSGNVNAGANLAVAVNTTLGGTLGVTGVSTLSGNVNAGANLAVAVNTTIGGTLGVTGVSTLTGNVNAGANLTVAGISTLTGNVNAGANLAVAANTTISGTLGVTGVSTLTGNVNAGADLNVGNDLWVGNDADIDNDLWVAGNGDIAVDLDVGIDLWVGNDADIDNDLCVGNDAVIDSDLWVDNDADIDNDLWVGNDADIGNDLWVGNDADINNDLWVGNDAEIVCSLGVGMAVPAAAVCGDVYVAGKLDTNALHGKSAVLDLLDVNQGLTAAFLNVTGNAIFDEDLEVRDELAVEGRLFTQRISPIADGQLININGGIVTAADVVVGGTLCGLAGAPVTVNAATFLDDVTVAGNLTVDGGVSASFLHSSGNVIIDEDLEVGDELVVKGKLFTQEIVPCDDAQDIRIDGDVTVAGDLIVNGVKFFAQPHPEDSTLLIAYAALEGPEAGTYVRGTAQLINGETTIDLPESFHLVTSEQGLTVQVTLLEECNGLYVASKSTEEIVVREMLDGTSNARFDFFIQGVRRGYEDLDPIREVSSDGA